jgi:S-adenosylmethionine synthetase
MDATDRIVEVFNRLVALGRDGVASRPVAEQMVYYVVATRCEIDIDGFLSVYEQDLNPTEVNILVQGLNRIGENDLADEFFRGFDSLTQDGFYEHMNLSRVSDSVVAELKAIGERVADRLWELDDKLAALLDEAGRDGTTF